MPDELARLAAAHRRDVTRSDKSREALHAAILAALETGLTQSEVARRAGYTRENIRLIVAAAKRSR